MTKIIDLPTTVSTDANTFVPVYKNGKTQKVSATVFGGGGSGLDLTSTTDVPTVEGTEYIPLNKPLGSVFRVTVQRILDWILARAHTWTGNQTFNANVNFTGTGRRITGDFSNATVANRLMFQTSSANNISIVRTIPNGTGNYAEIGVGNNSDQGAAISTAFLSISATEARLSSSQANGGVLLPLTVHAGGSQRLRIDPTTGNVLATSGALGYGVGAGGTVVQPTSKNTTVTLNKICGQITMNNAALAAGASVTFQLNDILITNADCLAVTLRDDFSPANYSVRASVGTGGGRISITNISGVSLSEAVVLNFEIVKGTTS